MELRRIFPFALNVTDLKSLLISVAIHLIIGVVGGVLVKIISIVPLIGTIVAWLLGLIFGLYVLIGLVLAVLTFLGRRR